MRAPFPKPFVWGVASSAPQIEGAARVDGKGPSIWDVFARQPGKIFQGDTPEVACDHYHRFAEDFALMRELGVKHYRLSLAWPRLFPRGEGAVNAAGLDFYRRLLDALAEQDITPWVTLFHWDLPQALEDQGGWRSRATVRAFAEYVDAVVPALASRVKRWITLNEISCFIGGGYADGIAAPGLRLEAGEVNQAYHHALLCHGEAVRAVREYGGRGAQVGLTDNPPVALPLTELEPDIAAARDWFAFESRRVLDPVYRGEYAPRYLRAAGRARPRSKRGDFDLISQPTDFLGLNIYSGSFIRAGFRGRPEKVPFPERFPRADSSWAQLTPSALYWGPRFAAELSGAKHIYITENGAGYDDDQVVAGECLDLHRCQMLRSYLSELQRGIADGVPVRGYFLWSFLDNFEWWEGYRRRFGICHVDYATQRRTPKQSARWYAAVMRHNRIL